MFTRDENLDHLLAYLSQECEGDWHDALVSLRADHAKLLAAVRMDLSYYYRMLKRLASEEEYDTAFDSTSAVLGNFGPVTP